MGIPAAISGQFTATTRVQRSVHDIKQDLLPAVPVGKKRIVTQVILKNVTHPGDHDVLNFGFANDCQDLNMDSNSLMGMDSPLMFRKLSASGGVVGVGGAVFGVVFDGDVTNGTVDIDVFYFDFDA